MEVTTRSFNTDAEMRLTPDDIEKIEITREFGGTIQVRLCFRSTGEPVSFEFAEMKKAIEFYEVLWSSRTSAPSVEGEPAEVT